MPACDDNLDADMPQYRQKGLAAPVRNLVEHGATAISARTASMSVSFAFPLERLAGHNTSL